MLKKRPNTQTKTKRQVTPSQKALLVKLWENGMFIHFVAGLNARCFISGTMENARITTVDKLIELGFLRQGKTDWRGSEWYLSEIGKLEAMK